MHHNDTHTTPRNYTPRNRITVAQATTRYELYALPTPWSGDAPQRTKARELQARMRIEQIIAERKLL